MMHIHISKLELRFHIMKKLIHTLTLPAVIAGIFLPTFSVWSNPSDEDRQYIQQYCEQTYGNAYYDQEEDRAKAINECIEEQSQYYTQDSSGQPSD